VHQNNLLHKSRQEGRLGFELRILLGGNPCYFSVSVLEQLNLIILILLFLLLMLQLTQADVKHFFESICGEVCGYSLNWASSFYRFLNLTIL